MNITGAHALLKMMESAGISQVFGYPGGCIMPLYDALPDSPIQHYLCRHEQACALAADGYARASGNIGVAIATSGPGATNLITGVANAAMDSVPMLVITGQVPAPLIGTDAFQEVDVLGMTFGITKHSYIVTRSEDILRTVGEAISLAQSGRPGPVWIDISKDALLGTVKSSSVQTASFEIPALEESSQGITSFHSSRPVALKYHDDGNEKTESQLDLIQQVKQVIGRSRRPLLYSGGGVSIGKALGEYRNFREITGIPSVETLNGLGNAGHDSVGNLGLVGMHGSRAANTAVDECDLLIAVGARFDDRATGELDSFAANATIIHFDIDPSEHNKLKRAELFLSGQLKHNLTALSDSSLAQLDVSVWRNRCLSLHRQHGFRAMKSRKKINGPDVLARLNLCSTGAIVSCDVGQHQMWVAQYLDFERPEKHLSSGGLGTMGYGLPAAIGAQVRFPENTVISVCGDGSFMMNIQELATLKRYDLPVKIIVLDNAHLGMVRQQQNLFYQQRYSETDLDDNPCFSDIARAFGIAGKTIEDSSSVESGLNWLLAERGPALLHIVIERDSGVWPMVPPGAPNTHMLEGNCDV